MNDNKTRLEELAIKYEEYKALEREAKANKEEIKQMIIEELNGEQEATAGYKKITYKPVVKNTIDTTKLKKEQPALAAEYNKQTTSMTLLIS